MGRKKKKTKGKNKGKDKTQPLTGVSSNYKEPDCKHDQMIKVGNHEVYILSWSQFYPSKHREKMEALDVFLGLDYSYEKYESIGKTYRRPLLNTLSKAFSSGIESLLATTITDGRTDQRVYVLAKSLLEQNYKIGFGCMSAHGRTGWLLAKLIQYFEGVSGDIAISRARNRLCKKCVETEEQVKDLGAEHAKPSKAHLGYSAYESYSEAYDDWWYDHSCGIWRHIDDYHYTSAYNPETQRESYYPNTVSQREGYLAGLSPAERYPGDDEEDE